MELVILVVLVALIFEYINGFHDTANCIATVVSTKVLTPRQAVVLAALTNLAGAMLGTAVAKTISSGLVDAKLISVTSELLICALLGGILWNLLTWWLGLPSSSSHALIGGLCGAALAGAHGNWHVILWSQPNPVHWQQSGGLLWKVIFPMFSSPLSGFILGFGIMGLLYAGITWLNLTPRVVNGSSGKAQILSAAAMGLMHGTNDAQKTMGIIALALMTATTAGTFDNTSRWLHFLYYPEQGPAIAAAYNQIGECQRAGRGTTRDPQAASQAFAHAAKNKDLNGQVNLALMCLSGDGVSKNEAMAIAELQQAASKGSYAAQTNLALLYREGIGVAKDEKAAQAWWAQAATNTPATSVTPFQTRKLKGLPDDPGLALAWLKENAEKNRADAQVTLGVWYATGKNTSANPAEAMRWLQKAAERRHPDAMYNLGLMHLQGIGTLPNPTQAYAWFQRTADTEDIKLWVKIICAITIAAGTAAGGWRIIKTLGHKMVKLQPINGFAAQTSTAIVIYVATVLGIPVSTTHNITASIMGVGAARRFTAIKWTVVERMVWAWILTIPVSGALGYAFVRVAQLAGWIH